MKEERAEDGALIRAWRLVRNGRVKFAGRQFRHKDLEAHEGRYVPITWTDYWMRKAEFQKSIFETTVLQEVTPNGGIKPTAEPFGLNELLAGGPQRSEIWTAG